MHRRSLGTELESNRRRRLFIDTAKGVAGVWRRSPRLQLVIAAGLSLLCVFLFGAAWVGEGLPGVPQGDLPGAAAELARWRALLDQGALLALWDNSSFFGHPRSLMNLYSGMVLAYAPFALFLEPLAAVKIGSLVYLGLSGAIAFALMREVLRHSGLALVLGVGYALHPIHLSVAVSNSHANFPPFYALAPWLVLISLRLIRRPTPRLVAAGSFVLAAAAWVDLERVAVLMPGLVILVVGMRFGRAVTAWRRCRFDWRHEVRPLLACGLSLAGAGGLLGFLLLPALAEQSAHALFDEATRQSSLAFFSLQNPFYYVDRAGQWLSSVYHELPAAQSHDAGTFYLGWTLLLLTGVGLVFAPRCRRYRHLLIGAVVAGAFSLAAAQGNISGYQALTDILDRILLRDRARQAAAGPLQIALLSLLALGVALIASSWWYNRAGKWQSLWLVLAVAVPVGVVLLIKPLPWTLAHLPLYDEMRNPGWFATATPTLAILIAGGIGARELLKRLPGRGAHGLLIIAIAGGFAWDLWPYRSGFDNQAPATVHAELAVVGRFLEDEGKPGRVMSRESYNPRADMLTLHTDRPVAFAWLNWMATRGTSELMLDSIYPNLHRPETIDAALKAAGAGHVRYVLYDLDEGPPPPPTEALTPRWEGEHFALYENRYCQPHARLTSSSDASTVSVERHAPGSFMMTVQAAESTDLVLAESYAPGWSATIDGEPIDVAAARGALIQLPVPTGNHRIQLLYQRHIAYVGGVLITAITLTAMGLLLVRPEAAGTCRHLLADRSLPRLRPRSVR